jgi:hypothetical protein
MKECLDEGILQSYFDGELSIEMMEKASSHLTSCMVCKRATRELESESVLLAQALEPEFAQSVPTARLRSRIEAAVAERQLLNPARPGLGSKPATSFVQGWFQSFADLFAISPQRALGYAGVTAVILFAITFALVRFKSGRNQTPTRPEVAVRQTPAAPASIPTSTQAPIAAKVADRLAEKRPKEFVAGVNRTPHRPTPRPEADDHVKLLPGERSYLKTIAALDTSLKSDRNRPLRPALQSEYERNLAMVDRAIAATRNAAKSNPNDPEAAEFMFAAYQTKVDLLNQVAEARLPNRQQ